MHSVKALGAIFLLVSFSAFSQQIDLTWGPEKKYEKSSEELGYVGRVKDHFYTLRREKKIMYLAKTRIKDMSQVWEKEITWGAGRKNQNDDNLSFKSFRLFKTHFVFYFEDYSAKEDLIRVYAQKISFEGTPVGDLAEVGSRKKERRSKDGNFNLSYSADSASFLVTTHPSYEKYTNERFVFKVVNSDLKILHGLEVTLPFPDKDFEVKSIQLSRNNTIYVLAKIYLSKRDRKDEEPNYYYEILTIDPAEKGKVKEFEVRLDKRYVDGVDLIFDDKGNAKCFGFYGDMETNGRRKDGLNGVFYFSLINGQATNISIKEFNAGLVAEISGRKRANRNKGLESTFELRYFFNKADGGAVILAEEYYIYFVTTTTSSGNGARSHHTTTYYNYNSILAVNIDPKGHIVWYAHVPKTQNLTDPSFGSFHALHVDGKTHIVYSDQEDNAVSKTFDKTMRDPLKSIPVVVTINESGKTDKKMLGMKKEKSFVLRPRLADKISDSEAFFYGDRWKRPCCIIGGGIKGSRFGILTIK